MTKPLSWSKVRVLVGKTGDGDALATKWFNLGTLKNESTTTASEEGETKELKATGGELIESLVGEGTFKITTVLVEPDWRVMKQFLPSEDYTEGGKTGLRVKSMVSPDYWSVKLVGYAPGTASLAVRKCKVGIAQARSETEGTALTFTFTAFKVYNPEEIYTTWDTVATDITAADAATIEAYLGD